MKMTTQRQFYCFFSVNLTFFWFVSLCNRNFRKAAGETAGVIELSGDSVSFS